jgi:hypothetical protein
MAGLFTIEDGAVFRRRRRKKWSIACSESSSIRGTLFLIEREMHRQRAFLTQALVGNRSISVAHLLARQMLWQAMLRIRNDKSLAPYRDCLGGKDTGKVICWGRGSFDRGDLKEAAGAAVRAMEPQA